MERYPFDDEYVRRLKEGDPETESHFVSFFKPLLLARLRGRMVRGRPATLDVIEDIRQDVYLRVIVAVKKGQVRDGRAFGAFVYMVCHHVMQEYNRVPQAVPLDDTNARHDPPTPEESAEAVLINDERSAKVRRIVGGPERDAQIVRALFLEDRDKDQVCAEFGIDRGYLRVLLHRALKRFREDF